jgi:tetratricopeptide (TPR) repeat protein
MSSTSGGSPDANASLRRRGALGCAIAVILAGLVYVNALNNPFIYDDYHLIVENTALTNPGSLAAVVRHDVTRPVVALSYALDWRIWGGAPFGFHLTSLLLHMLNVGLFALLVWRACDDRQQNPRNLRNPRNLDSYLVAPVAALLFAVHPMMTEAVGYISGRSELLCAAFFLLGLQAARAAILTGRTAWVAAALALWAGAVGSKETALVFPFLVFAYDRWVIGSAAAAARPRWRVHAPLILAALVLASARIVVFVWIEHARDVVLRPELIWVELDAVRQYLTMLVVPGGQAIFHAVSPIGVWDARGWIAAALVAFLIVAAWRMRRGHALGSFAIAWFLLLLLPSSVLVALDRGEPIAEYRVYLASLGFFLGAGLAINRAAIFLETRGARTGVVVTAVMAAAVLSFGGRTVLRNQLWSNPILVWLEAAERAPDSWFPALLLGEELHRAGDHEQAIGAYRRAIQARPQEPGPHAKLGLCQAELRDLDDAESEFGRARALDPSLAEATNGLATVSLLRGDLKTARLRYLDTLAIDQVNIAARRGLAAIEEAPGGNPAEALRWCEDIRRLAPETPGNDDCIRRNQDRIASRTSGS